MKVALAAVAVAGLAMAAPVSAQLRTMQLDINALGFQSYSGANGSGAAVPFGGITHTGSLVLNNIPISLLADIGMQTGGSGPFAPQAFTGTLGSTAIAINLNAGNVTGGSMMVHVGSDMYSAMIGSGGSVSTFVGGGFKIEGLTSSGAFSGATFAGVPIADFFANQSGGGLPGYFINFRIQPNTAGAGDADVDLFVQNIPTPGTAAVLALGGLMAFRRRR